MDDSLKFFKVATTNFKKCSKASSFSVASTSTIVSSFINEPKPKPKTTETKTRKPPAKRVTKKSKTQPDIRKAISKREKLFNHVLTENCQQDGLDPDEVQLALAISESMMDQSGPSTSETTKFENPFNSGIGKVQSITTVLERYGFKCKNNYTEYELGMITNTKLTTKKSRFMKVPTELTRTTADKREKLIRLRVMDILDENQSQTVDKVFDQFSYKVSSFFLQEFHEQVNTTFKISSDDRPMDDSLMLYYVESLFEPSFVKADHLLKDWKKVPGRESTPDKDVNKELLKVTQSSSQNDIIEMFQVNSAVSSEEPEQYMKQAEDTSEPVVQEQEASVLVEKNQESLSVVIESQEVVEIPDDQQVEAKPKKLEKMILTNSCSDLFADTSDVANFSDFDDSDDVCVIPSDDNSEELKTILATQLQSLHSKLSISVAGSQIEEIINEVEDDVEIPETPKLQDTIDDLEGNLMEYEEDVSLDEDNCDDLKQMEVSRSIQGDKGVALTQIPETTKLQDTIDELEANLMEFEEDVSLVEDNCVDLTQLEVSSSIQGDERVDLTQMEVSRSIQSDSRIDLTHYESADETATIIPFDDSLISLQAHIKKLEAEAKAFRERKLEHQELNSSDNTSIIKIDLLSSDEEEAPIMETVVIPSSEEIVVEENNPVSSQIIEEDLFEDPEELNFICTNNSQMDDEKDQIISDEEINYSIKKFYSYKECQASQESQESQASQEIQENEIIPPAAPYEEEEEEVFFELENWRDDVFGDSMTAESNFNINESVMGLLETSVIPDVTNKKDHSTRFHDSEILSDSIREILKKYQDPKDKEVSSSSRSSRSLKKMQSETNILNECRKQRKSVHFNFNDDFNESINNPPAILEESSAWRLNNSVHEPLNDSVDDTPCSPVAAPKKVKPSASKTASRISLGVPKDNDYIIDTSRKFPDPDFHSMTPVELKQQLFKIGVRPLSVKKAIELLEYIYEQLHPQIRIAADGEIDVNDSRLLMNATDILTNINDSDDFVFTPGLVEDEDYVLPKMRKTKVFLL